MYVTYEGNDEVIIGTLEDEAEILKVYFVEGRRNLEEYTRSQRTEPVWVECSTNISVSSRPTTKETK